MQRVEIEIPEKILFTHHFTISEKDINIANHMGNERILFIANDLRVLMFEHLNLLLHDAENGHGTIVANHTINYRKEGFLGDEITCHAGVTNVTECSFDLIFNFIKSDGKTLIVLRSGCVYYEYQQRKIRPLPDSYLKVFGTGNP